VVAIVGWFQIFTVTSHAASRLTSSALSESMKRLNIYSKELLSFARANQQDHFEYKIAIDMRAAASIAFAYADAVRTLLEAVS